MNERLRQLAEHYKNYEGTDRLEVHFVILCKILAGYERYGFLEEHLEGQLRVRGLIQAMVENNPDYAFDFGYRLLAVSEGDDQSVKSPNKLLANRGLAMTSSSRLREQLIATLDDPDSQAFFLQRLTDFLMIDLDTIPVDMLHQSVEVRSKLMALIVIFDIGYELDTPAIRQLLEIASTEMTKPSVVRTVYYYEGFDDTNKIYLALKNRLP